MADTYYKDKYTQIMQVPAPDDLVNGWYTCAPVEVAGECALKRGTLLMGSGKAFSAATSEGLASADEAAILCADAEVPAGQKAVREAYFSGEFLGSRVILPWETEEDDHGELIDGIRAALRKHNLMVR